MRIEHIFLQVLILRIQFMYVQLVFAFASSYIAKFYLKKKSTGTLFIMVGTLYVKLYNEDT